MLTVEQIKDEASYCGFIGSVEQLVVFVRRIEAASAAPPEQHPAFAFRECEDSHAGEPVPQTISGVPPELFAQQIAAAMRYADAPLSHDQFVTLVLYLKAAQSV